MNRSIIISLGVIFLAACSSSSGSSAGSGAGGGGTGPAGPSGGMFLVACDNPLGNMAGSLVHLCQNYYANAGPAAAPLTKAAQSTCMAGGGTVLTAPCTTSDSVGGCLINPYGGGPTDGSVLSEGNPDGYYVVQIAYSPGATAAFEQTNCQSQGTTYVPPSGGTTGTGMDGGASGTRMDAGSGSTSDVDASSQAGGSNTCTMTVTGDQASGVGTHTMQGQVGAALLSVSTVEISCVTNIPTDGGGVPNSLVWQTHFTVPIQAPVTISYPPFNTGGLPLVPPDFSAQISPPFLEDPTPNGGVALSGTSFATPNGYGSWNCVVSPSYDGGGGVITAGTFTFTLSSFVAVAKTNFYRVKASGHAVCADTVLNPITGMPESPGTVTIDLTMN